MSKVSKEYSMAVSVSRVAAMSMIIVCHLGSATGYSAIGQLFSTGTQVFLFISGYLYSTSEINSTKVWLWGRFVRICIPCYLFIVGSIIVDLCLGIDFSWTMAGLCFFNLEGYHHIFNAIYYIPAIPGTAHLWFITILIICYLLTILIKRKPGCLKSLMLFLSVGIIFGLAEIRLDYFWIYFAGYVYGIRNGEIGCKKYKYVILCVAAIAAGMLRIIVKGYCDIYGENNFYLFIIIPFVYNILAIWIFATIEILTGIKMIAEILGKIPVRKVVLWVDGISFYVFITHYIFIDGPLRILESTSYSFLNATLLIIIITAVSILLKKISSLVGNWMNIRSGMV